MNNTSIKIFVCRVLLLVSVLGLITSKAYGDPGGNYYAKLTAYATPTGSGTVYVENAKTEGYEASKTGGSYSGKKSSEVTINSYAQANTGYHFVGWADSQNGQTKSTANPYGGKYTTSANKNENNAAQYSIYAIFAINTYTVKFNANGGSGTMANQTYTYNQAQNLRSNTFSKSYTLTYDTGGDAISPTVKNVDFLGWHCEKDGQNYSNGQSLTISTGNHGDEWTMTARWGANPTVTLPTPTKTIGGISRSFLGWYDAASGGNKVGDAGAQLTLTGDRTIYAHWAEYDITINVSGTPDKAGEMIFFTLTRAPQNAEPTLTYTVPITLGAGASAVIKGVPPGSYTATSIGWGWNYTVTPGSTTQTVNSNSIFNFTAATKSSTKEHDEKSVVNWGSN